MLYPCDGSERREAGAEMAHRPGIAYMRTSRPKTPIIYETNETFPIGGCKVIRQSADDGAAVVGAGVTLFEALKAHDLLKSEGIAIRVIDLYWVETGRYPDAARRRGKATGGRIITVEDHYAREASATRSRRRSPPAGSQSAAWPCEKSRAAVSPTNSSIATASRPATSSTQSGRWFLLLSGRGRLQRPVEAGFSRPGCGGGRRPSMGSPKGLDCPSMGSPKRAGLLRPRGFRQAADAGEHLTQQFGALGHQLEQVARPMRARSRLRTVAFSPTSALQRGERSDHVAAFAVSVAPSGCCELALAGEHESVAGGDDAAKSGAPVSIVTVCAIAASCRVSSAGSCEKDGAR